MTESTADNVIEIAVRLRDGRAVKTDEDYQQWFYEYFDQLTKEIGRDRTPDQIFPAMIRVMVEWVEAIRGIDAECDLETVRAFGRCRERSDGLPQEMPRIDGRAVFMSHDRA
jgi:hypothetical protein